jgi:cytochrome P450/GNAT superfamily N-acetyltransferase
VYALSCINNRETASLYESFTYPYYRAKLQAIEPEGFVVAIAANSDLGEPIGLALAEIGQDSKFALVLSIFVKPNYRSQGIGTTLLIRLGEELAIRGCTEAKLRYVTGKPTTPALESLLTKCNWAHPQFNFLVCKSNLTNILNAPWMHKEYRLPPSFTIFPWGEMTSEERQTIQQEQEANPWIPDFHVPSTHETDNLEPLNSLGLRYKGQVVGWILTHRIAPDTIRYTSMFVRQDLQKMARGIALLVNAIRLQDKANIPNGIWIVSNKNMPMVGFVKKRMLAYLTSVEENKGSLKSLNGKIQNETVIVNQNESDLQVAPGPQGDPILGSLPEFQKDLLHFFQSARRQYGNVVRFRLGASTLHLISHPEDIKYVLQNNNKNYRKSKGYENFEPILGQGLLTSEGEIWRRDRRLMQPAFHHERIARFSKTMTDATEAMLEKWHSTQERSEPINVTTEMMRLTLSIVCRTLFSSDISEQASVVEQAFNIVFKHADDRINIFLTTPQNIPTGENLRFEEAIHTLDRVVFDLINQRRQSGTDTGDLLSMLVFARDEETGEGMSDKQLRDEVMTILLGGYDATLNALSWTWYLLSEHPEVERRLHVELNEVLGGRVPTLSDLKNLKYTSMVLNESMRLYPPIWQIARQAIAADKIGGYDIPANSTVIISSYVTHRDSDFWQNPESFEPERFLPERSAGRPQYAYYPFGGGSRTCIGNNFALMLTQLVIATVAQRYQLELVPGHRVELEPMITALRARHGILMNLRQRG